MGNAKGPCCQPAVMWMCVERTVVVTRLARDEDDRKVVPHEHTYLNNLKSLRRSNTEDARGALVHNRTLT